MLRSVLPNMEPFDSSDSWEKNTIDIIDRISCELADSLPPPDRNLMMVVIIPAKDESNYITNTLRSLGQQVDKDGLTFDSSIFEILVLAHNCTDDTCRHSELFFMKNPEIHGHVLTLNSDTANTVGAARRVLMNIAYGRLTCSNGLIISTDSDTIPDKKWLYYLRDYLDKEVSLICGLILPDSQELEPQAMTYLSAKDEYLMLKSKLEAELLPNPHDPWPRHSYHWGPNMAIKKFVYAAIGGIRPLHFLEDVDMYNRVISKGYSARHCIKAKVTTSTRIDSRCMEGFGAELRVWTNYEGVSYNVEGFQKLLVRYEIYHVIKEHYPLSGKEYLLRISDLACIDLKELRKMVKECDRFEALTIKMGEHLNKSESWNSVYSNKGVMEVCEELKAHFDNSEDLDFTFSSPIT